MAPAGTRPRKNHEPALATGPLNGAYQLLLQGRYHRELKDHMCSPMQSEPKGQDARYPRERGSMGCILGLRAATPGNADRQLFEQATKRCFVRLPFCPKKHQSSRWSSIDSYDLNNEDHHPLSQIKNHPFSPSTISKI